MTSRDKDISIVIFDDEQARQRQADLLRDETGYLVHFVDLENKKVIDEVEKAIRDLAPPSLVLVDHILHKALAESTVQKGTSIVPLLRERWPRAPLIAITAAYDACVSDIDSDVYEDVIRFVWFSNFVSYAPAVIAGYEKLGGNLNDLDGLFLLLNVPDSEKAALGSSIPSAIKRSFGEPSCDHRIFRWFRAIFYREPGFLLDRRWTALAIGVSEEHFSNYEMGIADAQYNGVFAESNDPRWWKARLYSCLLPDSPERFTVSLCKAAKQKLQIHDDHASKCFRCEEKWPEVMGYVDESSIAEKDAKPLHLRCSRTHPLSAPEPYYEERRVMLDDK